MPFPIRLLLCVSLCAKCHFVYFHAVVHSGYIAGGSVPNIEIIQHFLLNNAALAATAAAVVAAAVSRQSIPSSILEELETTSLYFFFSAEVSIRSTRKQFLYSAGVSEEPRGGFRGS